VLRRILIDRARASRHRHTRLVDDALLDGETEGGYDTLLDRQLLAGAMEQLSPPHRDVLVETYYRDLPADRVAAALGVPVGTVRSRLHYALQALRRQLTEVRDGTGLLPATAAAPPVTKRQTSSRPGRRSQVAAAGSASIS
jgi:RNA polymerase sigma-70 factor (ECF subfamily)